MWVDEHVPTSDRKSILQMMPSNKQFKWSLDVRAPPTTMHNPQVFYETILVQWNIEHSNGIALKAVKKAEKDAKEALEHADNEFNSKRKCDMIYIKTQVFRLLRYYSPAPRNIARSDWVTQNITHNMTSSIIQPYRLHSLC